MEWKAFCTNCGKELFSAPNGAFAEGVGKNHAEKEKHKVIVGVQV